MSKQKGKTQKEFEGFVGTALRGPKMGIYQNLLAGLLIRASTVSDPLKKIQNLCEAAQLCKKKKGIDMDLIEVCSAVCESLQNTEANINPKRTFRVTWVFPETPENWSRYIEPWNKRYVGYYALRTSFGIDKDPLRHQEGFLYDYQTAEEIRAMKEKLNEEVTKQIRKMPKNKSFWIKTEALTIRSFACLKGEFSRWALTKLLPIQVTIADQIDPRVYGEVAALMMGRKEEGEEIESSVDQGKR